MTVIREKQSYNYPKPSSTTTSDTESLHLGSVSASDTESLNDEPHSTNRFRVYRPPSLQVSNIEELINIKKSSGKKKLRRYQNRCSLQTLSEKDEDENKVFVIMEQYKSPFARLLEDNDALKYWNDFIERSEAEQSEIMRSFSAECDRVAASNVASQAEKPGRISARIRRTIKIRKNLSLEIVKNSEDELIAFFIATPTDTYIKYPPTSFERLLLHGIAQYHRLKSVSVQVENGAQRSVEVYNNEKKWVPAECFLTDFIRQLRK